MSKKRKRKTPRRKAQHPFIASAMAIDRRQDPERRAGERPEWHERWSKSLKNFAQKLPSSKCRKITEPNTIHPLKCWPDYYQPIATGEKPFDVRVGNGLQYEVGHYLELLEWDPETKAFTGSSCTKKITYVMHGAPFLPEDTWVLGLSRESYA